MKKNLILIGGGGHCRSCIDVIENENVYSINGIIDLEDNFGNDISGYRVMGSDRNIPEYIGEDTFFLITVGQVKQPDRRVELFDMITRSGGTLPVIVSPDAHVSRHSTVKDGSIIMHNSLVNSSVEIGYNCIINTGAIVEHDVTTGSHCHISTGAVVNGGCRIGSGVFIGSNATVSQGIEIADDTVIGAASLVIRSIKEPGTYAGVPARKIG